jgi:hypothetical protein
MIEVVETSSYSAKNIHGLLRLQHTLALHTFVCAQSGFGTKCEERKSTHIQLQLGALVAESNLPNPFAAAITLCARLYRVGL